MLGTSGWFYKHWRGIFYPQELKPDRWLEHYAGFFNSVENNSCFYHLPKPSTVEGWRDRVPPGFRYAVKCWRVITHYRRLKEIDEPLEVFLERISPLSSRLAAVLFQFPPSLQQDLELLESFLAKIPPGYPPVFEFRHPSWFHQSTYDLLAEHGASLCLAHSGGRFPTEVKIITPMVYLRFHGPGQLYASRYGREALEPWARRVREWLAQGRTVLAYFNNDFSGFAIEDASILQELVQAGP